MPDPDVKKSTVSTDELGAILGIEAGRRHKILDGTTLGVALKLNVTEGEIDSIDVWISKDLDGPALAEWIEK